MFSSQPFHCSDIQIPFASVCAPITSSNCDGRNHCFSRTSSLKCAISKECRLSFSAASNDAASALASKLDNGWKKIGLDAPLFIQFLDTSPEDGGSIEGGKDEDIDRTTASDSGRGEDGGFPHQDNGQHRGGEDREVLEKVALEQEQIPSREVFFTPSRSGLDSSDDELDDVDTLWNEFELDIGKAVDLELDFLEEMFPAHRGLLTGRRVFSVGRQGFQSVLERIEHSAQQEGEDQKSDKEDDDEDGVNLQGKRKDHDADRSMTAYSTDGDIAKTGVATAAEDVKGGRAIHHAPSPDKQNVEGDEIAGNQAGSHLDASVQESDRQRIMATFGGGGVSADGQIVADPTELEDSASDGYAGVGGLSTPTSLSVSDRLRSFRAQSSTTDVFGTPESDVEELVRELVRDGKDVTNSVCDVMESYSSKLCTVDGNVVIRILGQKMHFRQAFAVFEWMRSHEPPMVNARSYSLIFPLLGKAGMLGKARIIFQNMRDDKGFHCIQVYNSYIGVLLTCGRQDEIDSVLVDMEKRGINQDAVTYSLYINRAVKEKRGLKEVLKLYDTMLGNGVAANTAVFGSVVKAFCVEGRFDDALVFVKEMEASGMAPNTLVFNTLIDAFGKAGKLDVAEWLLSEMKNRKLRLHMSTYNTLLNVYGKQGRLEVVEELFTEMQDAGLKPDVMTFTTLINSYAKKKMSEKAAGIFARMRKAGIFPNAHSYTALIHAYSEDEWHTKAAMVFENMKREGITPTAQTYTALLEGYRRAGAVEEVSKVWEEMKREGCQGTRITFNTLLDAFAKQGRFKEARDVVSEYASRGFKPDNLTYNMLINAYGRGGNHDKIPDLVKEMEKLGLKPDSYTYCCAIYAFLRMRDFTNVFRWFDTMLRNHQKPDPQTFSKLAALVQEKRQIKKSMKNRSIIGQQQRQAEEGEKTAPKQGGKNEFWKNKPRKCAKIRLKHKPKAS